jgi:hypothetical protein
MIKYYMLGLIYAATHHLGCAYFIAGRLQRVHIQWPGSAAGGRVLNMPEYFFGKEYILIL